jgi:hypothetical protein
LALLSRFLANRADFFLPSTAINAQVGRNAGKTRHAEGVKKESDLLAKSEPTVGDWVWYSKPSTNVIRRVLSTKQSASDCISPTSFFVAS